MFSCGINEGVAQLISYLDFTGIVDCRADVPRTSNNIQVNENRYSCIFRAFITSYTSYEDDVGTILHRTYSNFRTAMIIIIIVKDRHGR